MLTMSRRTSPFTMRSAWYAMPSMCQLSKKMAPGLTVRKHLIRNRSNRSRNAASSSRTSFACIIFFLDFTSDFGAQRVIDLVVFFSRDGRPCPAAGGGVVVALEGERHGFGIAGEEHPAAASALAAFARLPLTARHCMGDGWRASAC